MASPMPKAHSASMRTAVDEAVAIAEAAMSPEVQNAVEILTALDVPVRGCQVNPDRPHLQALQEVVLWTLGGYDTRPTPASLELKHQDKMHVLVNYRQNAPVEGEPPRVAMYEYLCDNLFGVPMRPVGPEVELISYTNDAGEIVVPEWVEADWDAFHSMGLDRPLPVFKPNRYPYQLPVVDGITAEHWILWYFHLPAEQLANPSDGEIESDLTAALMAEATSRGSEAFDYIWYRNPAMSVPDMFHVQVFWICRGGERSS